MPLNLTLLLLVLVTTMPAFAQREPAATELGHRIDAYLKKAADEQGFSGAVLVARKGEVLLEKGYGFSDKSRTVPTQSQTRYYIASITKQFTAAAILKLEEQGKLKVNDRLDRYWRDLPPDKAALTIHHLLSQSSGLAQNYAADGIKEREPAVRALLKPKLQHAAGEKFTYSNDNYCLLAALIEVVAGQSYEAFLRTQLLVPAGMSQTSFWGDAEPIPLASLTKRVPAKMAQANWGYRGATGIASTVGDLFRWQQALWQGKVLSEGSKQKLLTPYFNATNRMHCYGWFRGQTASGQEAVWTVGAEDIGHNGILRVYADDTVIIVLSNAGEIGGKLARTLVSDGIDEILFTHAASAR